jgi:DNA-binding response OmpR family regulator
MNEKKLIYVLDDCESTTFILQKWLSDLFDVETFQTPIGFIDRFKEKKPCLCILDVQLNANRNGMDVLKEVQMDAKKENIPFIFISQDDQAFRKSNAYQLGAVDYLKKPLVRDELQYKVSNIINLIYPSISEIDKILNLDEGNLTFTVQKDDNNIFIKLTPKEFIVFKHLFRNKNNIVSREQILLGLENSLNEKFVVDRVVDVHVCNIKKKLGPFKELINTVYGVGYRLDTSKIAS